MRPTHSLGLYFGAKTKLKRESECEGMRGGQLPPPESMRGEQHSSGVPPSRV